MPYCSGWSRLKLNTKIGLNHHPPTHHKLLNSSRHSRRLRLKYIGFTKSKDYSPPPKLPHLTLSPVRANIVVFSGVEHQAWTGGHI